MRSYAGLRSNVHVYFIIRFCSRIFAELPHYIAKFAGDHIHCAGAYKWRYLQCLRKHTGIKKRSILFGCVSPTLFMSSTLPPSYIHSFHPTPTDHTTGGRGPKHTTPHHRGGGYPYPWGVGGGGVCPEPWIIYIHRTKSLCVNTMCTCMSICVYGVGVIIDPAPALWNARQTSLHLKVVLWTSCVVE